MKPGVRESEAREIAVRLAGVAHARRLYGAEAPAWRQSLDILYARLSAALEELGTPELSVALLGEGLAVMGVPIADPPSAVLRLIGALKARDVEIISFLRGFDAAELETLLAFVNEDAADLVGVAADRWLRERGADRVRVKHLRLASKGAEGFRDVYRRGRRTFARVLDGAAKGAPVDARAMSDLARVLLEVVLGQDAPVATMLALRDRDDFAVVHSINVATLIGCQAAALSIPEDEVERMVVAGLLHDIGKARVPEQILREGPTNPRDRALLERHTFEGARVLFAGGPANRLAAIVAHRHHATPDEGPLPLAVHLCRIADVFDGIRSVRPFDDVHGMRGAVAYMVRRLGDRFDPHLLERFARLAGVALPGEHAWLSTGEIVRVLEPHAELAFHPRVEILDRRQGTFERGRGVDLAERASDPQAPSLVPPVPSWLADLEPQDLDALG